MPFGQSCQACSVSRPLGHHLANVHKKSVLQFQSTLYTPQTETAHLTPDASSFHPEPRTLLESDELGRKMANRLLDRDYTLAQFNTERYRAGGGFGEAPLQSLRILRPR